jgi:uracil-DNA glycosylase
MDSGRIQRLVLQHAESSRLLGVSFVPVYRRAGSAGDDLVAPERALEAWPEQHTPTPVAARPAVRPPPAAMLDGVPPRPTAPSSGASPPINLEIKPSTREPEDVQAALDDLRRRYELDAPHKHFVTAHTNIVFGEGDPCAKLMFVGEAPGAEEDRSGRPFVGRSGQLLDKMIVAMGLSRKQIYIANVLKTRPPDNATPTSEEIRLCAPYLFSQIAIIDPAAIVTLGLPATRALLNTTDSMSRLRGRWAAFRTPAGREIPVMPTYHPAFLLRSYTAENRAKVWSDLQQVMERLGLKGPAAADAERSDA